MLRTTEAPAKTPISLLVFSPLLLLLAYSGRILATTDLRKEYPVVPWEDLWEELEDMTTGKEHCHLENSLCWHNDTTDRRSPASPMKTDDLQVQCYCDDDCVRYGDCCRDKAEADWGDGREEGSSRYSCRRMQTRSFIGILMVETCLPEYSDKKVEALCLQQVPLESYSYVLDLPVTSAHTNTTYVNVHCASCNNDAQHLYTWNVTINCNTKMIQKEFSMSEFMSEALYVPGKRQWQRLTYRSEYDRKKGIFRDRYFCTLEVVEFKNETSFIQSYGGRLCIFPKSICDKNVVGRTLHCKEQIRHCDPSWPNLLDVDKCHRYSYLVTHTNEASQETFYKNPHCARCNFINVSDSTFQCADTTDPSNFRGRNRGTPLPVVFSVLMDFQGESCHDINELWDPIHKKCQKIYCGQLFKLENGKCIQDQLLGEMLENSTVLNRDCPKIRVLEYLILGNGSLIVNTSKKTYDLGEYEIVNDSMILVCKEEMRDLVHEYLTAVVLIISVIALALHIFIYILVPRFRNLPGKNLFSLACSLFIAHMLFLTGTKATENYGLCVFISASLHYFWIASFCWMNVMSVDVCRTFTSQVYRGDLNSQKTYAFYSLYAWGVPALVVGLALLFDNVDLVPDYQPEYGTKACWINNHYGLLLFHILPVGAIFVENVILYFVTVCGICKQAKAARYAGTRSQSLKEHQGDTRGKKIKNNNTQHVNTKASAQARRIRKDRVRVLLYVKLGLIQGLSWTFGFLAAFIDNQYLWYAFTVFNGLQGAFIFIAFDMKKKVGESVYEAITGKPWKKKQSSKMTHTSSMPQSTSTHNRSSKSYSDSDGETRNETSVSHMITEERSKVNQKDVCWSPNGDVNTSSQSKRKTTTYKPLGPPSYQLSNRQNTDQDKEFDSVNSSTRNRVRNGDLRASIVKGKFDDEKVDEASKITQPQKGDGGARLQRSKSDLQRVVDLLQQLQQSKNSGDLQGMVQQLIARKASASEGKSRHSNLSKCLSLAEGLSKVPQDPRKVVPTPIIHQPLSQEMDPHSAGQLAPQSCLANPAEGMVAAHSVTSLNIPYRPKSMLTNVTDDTSLRYPSRNFLFEEEAPRVRKDPQRDLWKKAKSQTFSQISQVALAATIMQRAAAESRDKRRELATVDSLEYDGRPNTSGGRDKEAPFESLV